MLQPLSFLSLCLGITLFFGGLWDQAATQKEFLAEKWKKNQQRLSSAIQEEWEGFQAEKLNSNTLEVRHLLQWEQGGTLKTLFFPSGKMAESWDKYLKLSLEEKKSFLQEMIQQKNSWNRLIALKLWKKISGEVFPIKLSDFESTFFDQRIYDIYQKLFENGANFQSIKNTLWTFQNNTFVRTNPEGFIETALPSKK